MFLALSVKLKSIAKFFPRKRVWFGITIFSALILAGSIFWSQAVAGAPGTVASVAGTQVDTGGVLGIISSILLYGARLFLGLAIFFLKFLIEIAGYNGYLDSPAVEVGWVMVRDVTNMFFVVILLLIAFGTILGIEQYEWKKLLVKFVFAAVLVNFSRLIAGVIIDVAQVFMITFINGVAATAGGNLMQAFKVEKLMEITSNTGKITSGSLFMASVAAITFTAMMMGVMAVYLAILVFRVVALWLLIVLSPFAFVLSVIPMTQKYANEWWQKFGSNVVSGPIIAFFLWLAFVTVGAGNIHNHIAGNTAVPESARITEEMEDVGGASAAMTQGMTLGQGEQSAGITDFMTWANMANFFIAIAILIAGAQMASQLGVAGGAAMGKAIDFGKKVALVGSGVAAGLWATKGAVGGVVGGVKKGAKWAALGAGGLALAATPFPDLYHNIGDFFKRKRKEIRNWRLEKSMLRPSREHLQFKTKVAGQKGEQWLTEKQIAALRATGKKVEKVRDKYGKVGVREGREKQNRLYRDEKNGHILTTDNKRYQVGMDERGLAQYIEVDADGTEVLDGKKLSYEQIAEKAFFTDTQGRRAKMGADGQYHAINEKGKEESEATEVQRVEVPIMETQEEYEKRRGWGFGAWTAYSVRKRASTQKKLKKTEDYQKTLEELLMAQTGGVPGTFWGRFTSDRRAWVDGEDRMAQGRLKAERARSAAKTEEYSALGEQATLANFRFKDGKYGTEKGTMAQQIEEHKAKAATTQAQIKELASMARNKFLTGKGKQFLAAKIRADLNVKTLDAEHKKLESRESLRYSKETAEGMEALRKRVEAEEKTKAEEAELKSWESGAKRKFFGSEADLREQAEKEAKEQGMEGNEKWIKQRTEQLMAQAQAEGGVGVLAEQQKWAQRAQRGDAILKQQEAEAKEKFLGEKAEGEAEALGARWLREQKRAEMGAERAVGAVQKIETQAKAVFAASDLGVALQEEINIDEELKKAAENVVKKIKDKLLDKAFADAKIQLDEAMKKVVDGTDIRAIDTAATVNPYVMALKAEKLAEDQAEDTKIRRGDAATAADNAFVNLPKGGIMTPSEGYAPSAKRLAAFLDKLDEPGRGRTLMNSIAQVLDLTGAEVSADGSATQRRTLNMGELKYAFGIMDNVLGAGNFDDAINSGALVINNFLRGQLKQGSLDEKRAKNLLSIFGPSGPLSIYDSVLERDSEDDFVDVNGNKIKDDDGNAIRIESELSDAQRSNIRKVVRSTSDKGRTAVWQHYVLSGGDMEMVQGHQAISKIVDEKKISYQNAALEHFRGNTVARDAYINKYRLIQTGANEAVENWKNKAFNAAHQQLGGLETTDEELGMVRFSTPAEATAIMNATARKIDLKKPQHHSLGKLDTVRQILYEFDPNDVFRNFAKVKDWQAAKNMFHDRTKVTAKGYKPGEKGEAPEGYGVYGKSKKDILARFGGFEEFIEGVVAPWVASAGEAYALDSWLMFGLVDKINADLGEIRESYFDIDGGEHKFNHSADLAEQVGLDLDGLKTRLNAKEAVATGEEKTRLQQRLARINSILGMMPTAIKEAKELKRKWESRGRAGGPAPREDEPEDAST